MNAGTARVATKARWLIRVLLPVLALAGAAVLLEHSRVDERALALFHASAADSVPLEAAWFFEGVLTRGASYVLMAASLVVGLKCWTSPRVWRANWAYLLACLGTTSALAASTPLLADALGLPAGMGPNLLAAAGFAWVALYFVGPTAGIVPRGVWLAPGLLLGLVLTSTQLVRGAHPPSSGFWSLTLAWTVALILAAAFRRKDWTMDTKASARSLGFDGSPRESDDRSAAALSWLAGACACLAGIGFFFLDLLLQILGSRVEAFEPAFEGVELSLTGLGLGAAAYFIAEHLRELRARAARRTAAEREERFRILGRMAASVAHEVRNPLHTLRLIVDEQCAEIPALASHSLQPEVEASIERIDRAVDLVYRLARPDGDESDTTDLARVVRESMVKAERMAPGLVRFRWNGPDDPALVRGSSVGVGIVVDNLVRNALDASPPGTVVEMELRHRAGAWELEITNQCTNGTANDSEEKKGLGLGLSISRQITSSAGGRIDLSVSGDKVTCRLAWPEDRMTTS